METEIKSRKAVAEGGVLPVVNSMTYSIYAGELEQIMLSRKTIINTINQYAYCVAEKDEAFKESLRKADILLPDGIGIVAAVKFLNRKKINKIAGIDLH